MNNKDFDELRKNDDLDLKNPNLQNKLNELYQYWSEMILKINLANLKIMNAHLTEKWVNKPNISLAKIMEDSK